MGYPSYDKNIAYETVSPEILTGSENDSLRPKYGSGQQLPAMEKRGWLWTILLQLLSALWLAPIVALLYLNFTSYIIGASAWCPGGHCWLDTFNPDTAVSEQRLRKFDRDDHNLLGGLQLVAKALEVWFCLVSAALVYLLTMIFAGKKEGLPIGYITRPSEFSEVVSLMDPLLWVTGPSPFGPKTAETKKVGRRVWCLIILSVFLCILCNLMGPATAVLVIPSLQWMETKEVGNRMFTGLNAADPPSSSYASWFWVHTYYCNEAQFSAKNYSCSLNPFGSTLDAWIDNYVGSWQGTGVTMQDYLTFSANSTSQVSSSNVYTQEFTNDIFWAPSRQIISNLSTDYETFAKVSAGWTIPDINTYNTNNVMLADPIETYLEYNKSLELEIHRNGPISGSLINMYVDYNAQNTWSVSVDEDREIRCYIGYDLYYTPLYEGAYSGDYTRCIRTGQGWSLENKQASFTVQGAYDPQLNTSGPDTKVTVYSSDKAVFYPNGTYPTSLHQSCLGYGKGVNSSTCNWDQIFATDPNSPVLNRTENATTIEFVMQEGNTTAKFVVDFNAFVAFTEYFLDPSPITNPNLLTQTENLPYSGQSFPIDPTWTLAAWAADSDGVLLPNRTSTSLLQFVMHQLLSNQTAGLDIIDDYSVDYVALLPVMQTLSLIDHSTEYISDTTGKSGDDATNPLLQRYARMYVWAYGMGSRTAWLGATVAILGALVVVWQFFLGIVDRRKYRSPTQLLVAALEHAPHGEFDGKERDEKAMARVRFHIRDDDGHVGKFSFYEASKDGF